MDLHVEVDPVSDRPALLLVHGFLSSRHHWLPNEALAGHFRRIRVELPGHGRSPAPADPAVYRPGALVAALERVRARLGIPRWHICGQSFGAALTLRYALDHPERVISQIFTNANGALRTGWSTERAAVHAGHMAAIRAEGAAALRRLPFHPAHARRFPPAIRARLSADADAADLTAILHLMAEATPHLPVRARFPATAVPTLLVNGRRERGFQPLRDWAAAALPTLRVVDLDGGHSINIEEPAAFDAAVIAFAAEHA